MPGNAIEEALLTRLDYPGHLDSGRVGGLAGAVSGLLTLLFLGGWPGLKQTPSCDPLRHAGKSRVAGVSTIGIGEAYDEPVGGKRSLIQSISMNTMWKTGQAGRFNNHPGRLISSLHPIAVRVARKFLCKFGWINRPCTAS